MVFKSFYLQIIWRIVLIVATSILLTWLVVEGYSPVFYLNLGLVLLLQIMLVIRYVNSWNTELYDFFKALNESGSEMPRNLGRDRLKPVWGPLNDMRQGVLKERKKHQVENEYFKVLSQQVATGILVTDREGQVLFHNEAFLRLFSLEVIRNLDGLERKHPGLAAQLSRMIPGFENELSISLKGMPKKLQVNLSVFNAANTTSRVFTFDDISSAINRSEVESWQKLIRVLNHEIMNSVGPISSTTEMLLEYWQSNNDEVPMDKVLSKTRRGLEIIGERSRGLGAFARAYRSLTRTPEPRMNPVELNEIVSHCVGLFQSQIENRNISLIVDIPEKASMLADPDFLQQILINLLKNSLEAFPDSLANHPQISLAYQRFGDKSCLTIADNGCGMTAQILQSATIPFYTTKTTGSGIGLSLSRQLMQAMNGSLEIKSNLDKGTEVKLYWFY